MNETGPHTDTHTQKENGPSGSLFGSPAEEDNSAGSQDGWLPGRWSSTPSRSSSRQKHGPGQPNPEEARRDGRPLVVVRQTRRLGCARCSQTQTRPKRARADRDAIIHSFFCPSGRGPLIRGLLSLGGPRVAAPPSCKGPALVCSSPIGRKMTHTLIWRTARTKHFVSEQRARTTPRAECCCWRC